MKQWLQWLTASFTLVTDPRARGAIAALRMLTWRQRVSLATGLARDPRLPRRVRFAPFLATAYILSPIDFVPDFIPLLGKLDDLFVLKLIFRLAGRSIPPGLIEEHLQRVASERP